ncbi:MAG TPA: XRE family transcriptional regulator [Cytophagales bacterium]|nr:XRE family transcriptional regulator [Cytophagales bacterium]HAP61572.1 XRE family transcriptional regulator [Cytophagales bacterium]
MESTLTFEEKYQIIVEKDARYVGIFYTAVKTTGIFCRPTCTARKPKPENVEFFDEANEAIRHGYRPCKVCKPMEDPEETPQEIQELIEELVKHPYLKISDAHLRERGLMPNTVRRWFKKHHKMTFQAYQRMLRINTAYHKISHGESVTEAAFDTGFNSLSGFTTRYKSIFKISASQAEGKNVITLVRFTTPLGPMFGATTDQGICLLEFTDRRMLETEFQDLAKRYGAVILPGTHPHLDQLQQEVKEYFEGTRTHFSLPLHLQGTPFQEQVWELLQGIPYGTTRSYAEQAEILSKPKAVRAVASANGYNRVAIVVPCHRVIGKNGSLTGYAGGLERKQWLLSHERDHAN